MQTVKKEFCRFLKRHLKHQVADITLYTKANAVITLHNNYGLDLKSPDPNHVLDMMDDSKLCYTTANTFRTVLKQFLQFRGFEIDEKLKKRLGYRTGQKKNSVRPKDLLTRDEIIGIIEHSNSPTLRGYYAVLYDTGARPSGILRCNIGDVVQDKFGFTLTINRAKNLQSRRTVRLIDPTMMRYFEIHWSRVSGDPPDTALFRNSNGNRYRARDISLFLWKHHRPRLNKTVNLYLFRKSRATQLLTEKKFSEIELKMRMGHKKGSQVLEKYYAIIDEQDQALAELNYIGVKSAKKDKSPPSIFCTNCGAPNVSDASRCQRCRMPLTEEELIKSTQKVSWMARADMDAKTITFMPTNPDEMVLLVRQLLKVAETMQKYGR